jgi:hypothetical protein
MTREEQRAALVEAMARAICAADDDIDLSTSDAEDCYRAMLTAGRVDRETDR